MNIWNIKFILYLMIGIAVTVGINACSTQTDSGEVKELRVSLQQGISNKSELQKSYAIFKDYLEQELQLKIKFIVSDSYQDQLDQFHLGKIDLILFGGRSFILAQEKDDADPLVMRGVDFNFISYFLVSNDSSASSISDLKGHSFSFGAKLSTSGHIMPRFFLSTQDIVPELFFSSVLYSGAHDTTAYWVQEGKVDVGVANSMVVDKMFSENQLSRNELKILWKTPPYPDYVWAARRQLAESIKANIIEAFIKLSIDNPSHNKVLTLMRATYYLPANNDDFDPLRKIVKNFGMLIP